MKMTDFARVFQPIPLRLNYRPISTIRYLLHALRAYVPKCQTPACTRFENGCSENSTQKLLTKYSTEENNKHVICRPRSVRIGKNCALGLGYGQDLWHSFSQYGPPGRQITYSYLHARLLSKYILYNHKNYIFLVCDWFKKLLFSTNSLAKLLSDGLLLDSLLLDSLLSDSSISQSHSKM